ncbi:MULTISPECIES: ribosomal protection-like ABC-F family protein [Flavobacteriales]|uniref:ATP-binding cassette domain-containing protein n=1 Tax=Chryseobacterium suipulveris TaxID=2929800 RepID=A0ABY4BRZ9_9FLAO|nr:MULTISPECIES: ABC-F family ATP-binding cassette domain-containing protein [Flavobacteriales]UOE40483.1 ATP-binding cassette domain-containing protein [Chryseobacterium suipulveris]HJD86317.1 ATP-binding cassette domain-containing protein [Empedobacter falsenii]
MLTIQNLSYSHPNKNTLFTNLSMTVNQSDKIALIGNNGVGKSTLLKLIAKDLKPDEGQITSQAKPYYIPQIFGQFNKLTIAQALQVETKLNALHKILSGSVDEKNYSLLNDDWTIEEKCQEALSYWDISDLSLSQKLSELSGGQKTKVFLAGLFIHQPSFVLLDEPSNHLDKSSRDLLYDFVQTSRATFIIVSHDRELLQLLNPIYELNRNEIKVYGGNYEFYKEQKEIEQNALSQDIQSKEKALRKAKEKERKTIERQNRLDSRGKKKQEKAGVARIMMNTLRNNAENSTSKMKSVHTEKIGSVSQELQELRSSLPDIDKMKFGFDNSALHKGKILFTANDLNFSYDTQPLWTENLNFKITSGERIALKGKNGSGKTTLIKLILGNIEPQTGKVYRADNKSVYIDQDYSLIDDKLKVYEQAEQFNTSALQEHEIKIRLNRFLFTKEDWDKSCNALSGGEKMRLMLCCLTINNQSPDIIILDEPTNNLDIQNIEILTRAINEYRGTLIVVSHDETFLEQTNIERTIQL